MQNQIYLLPWSGGSKCWARRSRNLTNLVKKLIASKNTVLHCYCGIASSVIFPLSRNKILSSRKMLGIETSPLLSPPNSLAIFTGGGERGMSPSPMAVSPSPSFTEIQDDIVALSSGFDRKKTLRRRLSTIGDSPPDSKEFLSQVSELQFTLEESSSDDECNPRKGIETVLDQLKKVTEYRGRNVSHIIVETSVKDLCTSYELLAEHDKLEFFNVVAENYGVNHEKVTEIAKSLVECKDDNTRVNIQEKLKTALIPQYQWLFSQIGRLDGGVKFLVDLRTDLCEIPLKYPESSSFHLKTMNSSLKDLISMWFAVGFCKLERVTWQSSCEMLQKISEYEAVHPMRNWTDLKRRVGSYRRCFIFKHASMPGEPIVVLHVALTNLVPKNINSIVTNFGSRTMSLDSNAELGNGLTENLDSITTAIFYSITSTQKGLAGIELGNYLIKQVVKELQNEFPKMSRFVTLSPIPGFRSWLLAELKTAQKDLNDGQYLFTSEELKKFSAIFECTTPLQVYKELNQVISQNEWVNNEKLADELENPLMRLCARYLVMTKRRGFAMDSVANFHLKNGAVIWRLNWEGNLKPRGLTQSCGIMVNYRYYLEDCESNSQNYMENHELKISDEVRHLVKLAKTQATPPVSPNTTKT